MTTEIQHVGSCTGGNTIPLDDEGRTYHFGCKAGEVANEILVVSDYGLAAEIAKNFEGTPFKRESNRGYTTWTGVYKEHKVSLVACGIGFAMMDFLIRELRAITSGPLTFIHLGSAPTPDPEIALGTAIIAKDCVAYQVDFEKAHTDDECPYQFFKKPVATSNAVVAAIEAGCRFIQVPYAFGRFASNPSFNAGVCAPSQESGGVGPFDFKTKGLMEKLEAECGKISSLEMDTYPLVWTANRAAEKNSIWTGAVSIAGSNLKGEYLPTEKIEELLLKVAPVLLAQLGALQQAR